MKKFSNFQINLLFLVKHHCLRVLCVSHDELNVVKRNFNVATGKSGHQSINGTHIVCSYLLNIHTFYYSLNLLKLLMLLYL